MSLVLRSDISNDLRQNADQIGSVPKAILEFAWNSVQYQPDGQTPKVSVSVSRGRSGIKIEIEDNGRGMDMADLQRFFTMHAENQDRREGRLGRGRFGTGAKAAAMAIADKLEVETVKDGKLIRTILTRAMLTPGRSEIGIPHEEQSTDKPNGTKITLRDLRVKRVNEEAACNFLIKGLGHTLATSEVTWNGRRLLYQEPAHLNEWSFEAPEEVTPLIGQVTLTLKYSETWLGEEDRGATIMALGVPHERNFLGVHSASPQAGRIFGSVDVPLLEEDDEEGRPAYTADRNPRLNRENQRVIALLDWIEDSIGQVVRQLDAEERARQDRVRQERLAKTARTIEEALNRRLQRAFENLERKLNLKTGAASIAGVDVQRSDVAETERVQTGDAGSEFVRDDSAETRYRDACEGEKGDIIVWEHDEKPHNGSRTAVGDPDVEARGVLDTAGEKGAKPRGTSSGERRNLRPKGTFRVVPKSLGADGPRAYYAASHLTIYVNTDHPQLLAAGDPESSEFKVLMAECAAAEFALAVTSIRIEHGDPNIDPAQWPTILTAVRQEANETAVELAEAIRGYRTRASVA